MIDELPRHAGFVPLDIGRMELAGFYLPLRSNASFSAGVEALRGRL
jgi:hypothetical protein